MKLIVWLLMLFPALVLAQPEKIQSASSPWIPVETKPVSPFRTPSGPGFTETFAEENPNRWPTGLRGGFTYTIKAIGYQIERRAADTNRAAHAWIPIAKKLTLNRIDTFMVQVDVLSRSDTYPDGGLLFGVADSLNYSQIRLIGNDKVVVQQFTNGKPDPAFVSAHLSVATVTLRAGRNRVAVWRRGNQLHVFINEQELPTSPFLFRPLRGNGIGVVLNGNWLSFRNLTVRTQ